MAVARHHRDVELVAVDAMQAYRSDQYLWWQVAEYIYDSFMIRSRTRG